MTDLERVQTLEKLMSKDVYALRRAVMHIIYDLRKDIDLPRLRVRICDNYKCEHGNLGGVGHDNQIWITDHALNNPPEILYHVVAHEIGHAVFNLPHDESCPLMTPYYGKNPPSRQTIVEILSRLKR